MDSDEQGLPAPGAALLLIIGEPFSEDQKSLILEEITKGFRCWDVEDTGIDINQELAQIANRASQGEEGANGERLIQHQSDNLAVEILVNPLSQTVKNSIKKLLIASSPTKYVIYAGHAFQGSGAWVLQDDVFAFNNLAQVFKNADVENALKQNIEANLTIHTLADNHWGTSISKADFTNNLRIQLNPPAKLENIHGVLQFTAYVGIFVSVTPVANLLQTSEQFGNISFTRPTLYIFPGCQGDSALFGVNGFNLLVNAGYNRRACFWDFARHLDRVDAMLLTHLGTDNIFGINAALQRKSSENIHPQIGYLFFNAPDKVVNLPVNEKGDADSKKAPSLLVNLAEEANNMTRMAKQLGISPQSCLRSATGQTVEPINLFHMLGHGSLDMYILNPVADSKELKEFFQQWSKQASNLGTSGPYSLQNAMSVCTLLVWKPYNPNEKIVRILFPGNAPQHKIAEGLEKMKTFAFLKHASCTAKDLQKPAAVKKTRPGTGGTTSKGTTRSTTSRTDTSRTLNSARTEFSRKPEPRSTTTRTEPRTFGATSPTKTARTAREDNNKKNGKVGEKTKSEEKDTKARPSSARPTSANSPTKTPRKPPSPTKATSPVKSPSPPKASSPVKSQSPPKATPLAKSPTKAKSPEKEPVSTPNEIQPNLTNVSSGDHSPMINHVDQQELKPESDQIQASQPDQLETSQTLDKAGSENHSARPEPEGQNYDKIPSILLSSADEIASVDRQKLEDLGISDDGHKPNESDVHNPFQTNGENDYEDIQPQALPEPAVIMESPCQESDAMMPNYDKKIESDEQELSEFSKVEEELQQLEEQQEDQGNKMYEDPAEDIPPSPEPAPEEQRDIQAYQSSMEASSVDPPSGFQTPVFNNDDLDAETANAPMSLEQKIQYGIDESSRSMAGIQEVDEEEHEDFNASNEFKDKPLSTNALREMGIYDDEEEDDLEEGNEKESGFEKDDVEDEVKQTLTQDQQSSQADYKKEIADKGDSSQEKEEAELDDEVVSDYRSSAERQFEDVDDDVNQDEGIELNAEEDNARKEEDDDEDSIPAAFDKDSSSETDMVQTDEQNADLDAEPSMGSNDQGLAEHLPNQEREDTDSIDGGTPDDDDKDIDEAFSQRMNGDENKMAEHSFPTSFPDQITVGDAKFNPFVGVDNQGATVNNLCQSQQAHNTYETDSDSELQGKDGELFDPVAEWGHPMGLPSPPPTARGDAKKSAASPQKSSSTDRRPASAPAKSAASTARSAKPGGLTRPGTATRRPGSSRSSPQTAKVPPLPPMTPFYLDLTYIPNHGDSAYSDVEFFKRVRARYYVLSALSPNPQVLDSLMEAKATWDEKDLEVTLIPTYDNETLRHWMGLNKEKLQELHIDMTPAVSRCTIQLQDLETSLPAYRLEV